MSNTDQAKAIADAMTTLWLDELPATIRVLGAVSDANRDYRPDPRSRSAWELATHIAISDNWFLDSIAQGEFHADREKAKAAAAALPDVNSVVALYKETVPAKLERLREMPADGLAEVVDFFGMMQKSRAAWIGFANNHSVHHRGQLSTHLRSMGCKVPDIYGPSADSEQARREG